MKKNTQYEQVGRYDFSKSKAIWAKHKKTIARTSPPRSGGVLGRCKCGGELVVLQSDHGFLVCSCVKCGEMQYWERVEAA